MLAGWVAFAVGARGEIRDNSFLWHVRAGLIQLDLGEVLTADPFSFTMQGAPWRTQSWLAELGYGWLDGLFGLAFVDLMLVGLGAMFLVAVSLYVWAVDDRPFAVGIYLVLTTVVQIGFWNPRPVVFSYVLFPLLMLAERDKRLRWSVPLLLWMWASVHGSFLIGAGYLVLQALRRRERDLAPMLAVSALASLATAHGWGVVETLWEFSRNTEALSGIREWATPDLLSVPFLPVLIALFLLMVASARGAIAKQDAWIVVPFVALVFSANRAVPSAWIALAPFVVAGLGAVRLPSSEPTAGQARVNAVAAAILIAVPLLIPRGGGISEEVFPVSALRYAGGSRMFHDDGTGGYLAYEYWPDRLLFVDDRAELYGERLTEFVRVRGGAAEWREVFERDAIDEALLSVDDPLAETLTLAGWKESYRDANWVLFRP